MHANEPVNANLNKMTERSRRQHERLRRTQSAPAGSPIMRSVRRRSIKDAFEIVSNEEVPEVPRGGARIRVLFAGMTYTEGQVEKRRLRLSGILNTSLFPGFEVSGVVDEVCTTVCETTDVRQGDRVIVYPEYNANTETGYAEFVTVSDLSDVIKVPTQLPLEVGSLLPCGALTAYSAVQLLRPHVVAKMENSEDPVNMLIVGAGGLALWSLRMALSYLSDKNCDNKLRLTIADTSIDGLTVAKQHGCFSVVHWSDELYEEHILERTQNVCQGGVDVMLDFVTSQRTIDRAHNILKEDGVLLVGGISRCDVSSRLEQLSEMKRTVLSLVRGSRDDLKEIVNRVADGKIKPPAFSVFPMEAADQVFNQLSQSQLHGRAVLSVSSIEEDEEEEEEVLEDNAMDEVLQH